MQILTLLASTLCVVTVLLVCAFFAHVQSKDSFDQKMAAYRRALEKAKQRAIEAKPEPVLQHMSLRHRKKALN